MVYRYIPFRWSSRRTKNNPNRFIVCDSKPVYNDFITPQIPFRIRSKEYKIKGYEIKNPADRLYSYSISITNLFRDERIKINYNRAAEIRPQVERIIVEAMRNGDRHRPTMDLVNFWIRDKALIHKLFKVFVPRYSEYNSAFTAIYPLGHEYDRFGLTITQLKDMKFSYHKWGDAVLEMRGNPLPPIIKPKVNEANLITNVLVGSARERYNRLKGTNSTISPGSEALDAC